MTEEDARLALLQTELQAIQSAIRGLDTITFQIKGWCVTTSLAVGGFAVAYHIPALLLVGGAAVIGFYLVNCQFKYIQRNFIDRNYEIDSALRKTGLMEFLRGHGGLQVVGTAAPLWKKRNLPSSWPGRVRHNLLDLLSEGLLPNTFGLYLFILVCLVVEAIILL
jgi:hypothetical protein